MNVKVSPVFPSQLLLYEFYDVRFVTLVYLVMRNGCNVFVIDKLKTVDTVGSTQKYIFEQKSWFISFIKFT